MSHNWYSEIRLHLTWHTKESMPLITPDVEEMVFASLREKASRLGNVSIEELGAIPTHIHIAVTVQPTVTPSQMIGEFEGDSSHEVNRRLGLGRKLLQWQSGYGVVSFGTKDMPWVCDYVRNQKERHAANNVFDRLEAITHPEG